MIKIYTEFKAVRKKLHIARAIAPFAPFETHHREKHPAYFRKADQLITITGLKDCDVAIYPEEWQGKKDQHLTKFVDRVRKAGKRTVVFMVQDFPRNPNEGLGSYKHPDVIILKTSCYASKGDTHALSALRPDMREFADQYKISTAPRGWKDVPTIGFCGQSNTSLRSRIVKSIRDSGLNDNFIIRPSFWAGLPRDAIINRTERYHKVRREFIQNMTQSDYCLCMRGAGNFSLRMCEAMACSRIPVFINTDCVLPYMNHIPWRDIVVWVDRPRDVVNDIREFHKRTKQSFREAQQRCREIWKDWLSLEGYISKLHLILSK